MILAAATLMGTASAQGSSGTTEISAHFVGYISVTAPDPITDWTLLVNQNNHYPNGRTATIASNLDSSHVDVGNILLQVSDARLPASFSPPKVPGKMTSDVDPANSEYQLINQLVVGASEQKSLTGTGQTIFELTAPGIASPAVTFDQLVEYTDYGADYYMIVRFTGTPSV